MLFMVGQGQWAGDDQPMELRLLDTPAVTNAIQGVIMESRDCAFPLLTTIIGTTDYKAAVQNVDGEWKAHIAPSMHQSQQCFQCSSPIPMPFIFVLVALLVGAKPRGPGMPRKDLLTANGQIFAGQGKALN